MYVKDSDARLRLLEAGMQEFLEFGYSHASLRRICSRAGLTTGAVYSCFQNKEDLFCAIVEDTAKGLSYRMRTSYEAECQDASLSVPNDVQMIGFLWHHRDEVMLLLEGAAGTRYASFLSSLEKEMVEMFSAFFLCHAGQEIDHDLVSIIVKMRLKSHIETLKCGYSLEKTMEIEKNLSQYSNAGFQKLIENTRNKKN